MGYCGAIGFWAYDNTDLQAYGHIDPKLVFKLYVGEAPTAYQLANPIVGETWKQILYVDQNNKPILDIFGKKQYIWLDTRILLPAKQMLVQFMYSTSAESNDSALGSLDGGGGFSALGVGAGGGLIGGILSASLGGVSQLNSTFCWHICSSKTKIDMVFPIDDTVRKNNGIIQIPGYIVAVLGAFAKPLNLSDGQKAYLGASLSGPGSRYGMTGDTNGEGITTSILIEQGGIYNFKPYTALFPSKTNDPQQNHKNFDTANLLLNVLFDPRAKAYRADNQDLTTKGFVAGPPNLYGPQFEVLSSNDVTANYIQIDMNKFGSKNGNVYVTACIASTRYFREYNLHKASILQTADQTGGAATQNLVDSTEVTSWHYQIAPTRVLKANILSLSTQQFIKLDQNYINTIKVGLDTFSSSQKSLLATQQKWETVNDWRISESFTYNIFQMYHADSTGIVLLTAGSGNLGDGDTTNVSVKLLLPTAKIKDQVWFKKYLSDNNLVGRSFANSPINVSDFYGALFDLSEWVNTVITDIYKVPYNRALALSLSSVNQSLGVGITNLDIIGVSGSTQFDLGSAVFKPIVASSVTPEAWEADTCEDIPGTAIGGTYYDPTSPAQQYSPFFTGAGLYLDTPWLLTTPFYHVLFNETARVYVERFLPNGLSFTPSGIYVFTLPNPQSSLSLDICPYNDEIFAFFEDNNVEGIVYYGFPNTTSAKFLGRLKYFATGTHDRGTYDSDTFKYVSYSLAAGQLPAYSEGALISCERNYICNAMPDSNGKIPTFDTIYTKGTWNVPQSISEPYMIQGAQSSSLYRDIILSYTISAGYTLGTDDDNSVSIFSQGESVGYDNLIAIEFQANNQVIDNIPIPVNAGTHKVFIDGHLYGGSPVILHGECLSLLNITGIDVVYTNSQQITEWQLVGKQTATAIDGNNRIHVFYADQTSGNISVAVSADLGATWSRYTDIIRLIQGETADTPYCICDKDSNTVYLFYILNTSYLMVKTIQTDWFVCKDQFLQYTPPTTFDQNSDDLLNITQYSQKGGQPLRQAISYFVVADISDIYVTNQTTIATKRLMTQTTVGQTKVFESARFTFSGNAKGTEGLQMDTSFVGGQYAVYRDSRGKFKVVFNPGTGNISIRTSTDLSHWYYDVKEAVVHMNLFTDDPTTDDLTASNPQIVYDSLNESVYLFYFNQGSLFVRRFDTNLLYPDSTTINDFATYASSGGTSNSSGSSSSSSVNSFFISDRLKTHIQITRKSTNLPLFLVGSMEVSLVTAIQQDTKNNVTGDLTKRQSSVDFAYADPSIFTDNFGVEDACKPVGYLLNGGVTRLLYRTADGLVYGMTLNAMIPTLDCQRRYKA